MDERRYIETDERISLVGEGDVLLAYVDFPLKEDNVHIISKTFVDESLRGQGVASKLLSLLLEKAKREGFLLIPVCSYAVSYFENHPETASFLAKR